MGTAGKGAWVVPVPAYREVEGWEEAGDDAPGFRCSHALTAVAPTKGHGRRLILFGGATAIEAGASSGMPGIRLAGVTNSVHSYDVETRRWTGLHPAGELSVAEGCTCCSCRRTDGCFPGWYWTSRALDR